VFSWNLKQIRYVLLAEQFDSFEELRIVAVVWLGGRPQVAVSWLLLAKFSMNEGLIKIPPFFEL